MSGSGRANAIYFFAKAIYMSEIPLSGQVRVSYPSAIPSFGCGIAFPPHPKCNVTPAKAMEDKETTHYPEEIEPPSIAMKEHSENIPFCCGPFTYKNSTF